MKQYIYNWNPLTLIREILVYEDGKLVSIIDASTKDGNNNYLEMAYEDGNFITSNKNIENLIEFEEIPTRVYQHHQILQNENGKYIIVSGKKWNDGITRTFSRDNEEFIKIISDTLENSGISYYDCASMNESLTPTNNLLKIKKLTYKTK